MCSPRDWLEARFAAREHAESRSSPEYPLNAVRDGAFAAELIRMQKRACRANAGGVPREMAAVRVARTREWPRFA